MALRKFRKNEGLLDRVSSLAGLIDDLPDDLSDEEVAGLVRVMPPDTARSVEAMLVSRSRRASLRFFKMLSTWLKDARRIQQQGGKVVLVPFNFPVEVVHIFRNAIPITSEVLTTLAAAALEGGGERYWEYAMGLGLPDTLCSSNTIELGSILAGEDFQPDAIIQAAPGGCDANSKIHEFVAAELGIPQFFLEKPTDSSSRGKQLYRKYLVKLLSDLEEFIGEKLDEDRVREVLGHANRSSDLYFELWELRKSVPSPVPNLFALWCYGVRFSMWGRPEAADCMQLMIDVAKERLAEGRYPAPEERARVLWLYTGYYFDLLGFYNWMEENGITYLTDMLGTFYPATVDTTSMDTMIDGMARAAWNMPMTRQMGNPSMMQSWIDDATYAITDLAANCAIYCGHHACKQTWSVFSATRTELQKRLGVPVMALQGDSWMKTMTPTSVMQEEIASFIDNVVVGRSKPKRPRPKRRRRA